MSDKPKTSPAQSGELTDSPMMAHLLEALKDGTDIGQYGRLTFAMVARHFLDDEEIIDLLSGQPSLDEQEARALLRQVQAHDYNPPTRERILQWQTQQEFQICPWPDDPNACNLYRELDFPQGIYDNIEDFWQEQAENGG